MLSYNPYYPFYSIEKPVEGNILQEYLKENYNTTLIIKSQKTKKYESKKIFNSKR